MSRTPEPIPVPARALRVGDRVLLEPWGEVMVSAIETLPNGDVRLWAPEEVCVGEYPGHKRLPTYPLMYGPESDATPSQVGTPQSEAERRTVALLAAAQAWPGGGVTIEDLAAGVIEVAEEFLTWLTPSETDRTTDSEETP